MRYDRNLGGKVEQRYPPVHEIPAVATRVDKDKGKLNNALDIKNRSIYYPYVKAPFGVP